MSSNKFPPLYKLHKLRKFFKQALLTGSRLPILHTNFDDDCMHEDAVNKQKGRWAS